MRRYGYFLLVGCFFLYKCSSNSSKEDGNTASQPPRDNYIVLLDLGNRVLNNNEAEVPKDIELVKSIYSIFTARLQQKDSTGDYYHLGDKLKLLGAPHWVYANIDLSAEQPAKKALATGKMEANLEFILPDIYKAVITGSTGTTYSGAAIWNYFDEHLAGDLDKNGENKLFILTDGYMQVHNPAEHPAPKNRFASCSQVVDALKDQPDWQEQFRKGDYGLIPVSKKMPANLQVLVLQVNARQGWTAEDSLLTMIWDKWFTEMGVSNYQLIRQDSMQKVKSLLAKLMNTAIDTSAHTEEWTQITARDTTSATAAVPASDADKTTGTQPAVPPTGVAENKTFTTRSAAKALPAVEKEKTGLSPIPADAAGAEKKAVPALPKTKTNTDVLPPDESDAGLLTGKKPLKAAAKKTGSRNEDDILQDDAAGNGFNTGIKKDNKKKKQ